VKIMHFFLCCFKWYFKFRFIYALAIFPSFIYMNLNGSKILIYMRIYEREREKEKKKFFFTNQKYLIINYNNFFFFFLRLFLSFLSLFLFRFKFWFVFRFIGFSTFFENLKLKIYLVRFFAWSPSLVYIYIL